MVRSLEDSLAHGAIARSTTIVVPPPGVSSIDSSAPMARVKPRATAKPSPTPAPACGRRSSWRWNGSKARRALGGREPGAASRPPSGAPGRRWRRPRRGAARPTRRTCSALSTRLATTRSSKVGSARTSGRRLGHVDVDVPGPGTEPGHGRRHDLVQAGRAHVGAHRAGLDAATCRAGCRRASPTASVSPSIVARKSAVCTADQSRSGWRRLSIDALIAGQRGAQVVGHGLQQRAAQLVGLAPSAAASAASAWSRRRSRATARLAAKASSTRLVLWADVVRRRGPARVPHREAGSRRRRSGRSARPRRRRSSSQPSTTRRSRPTPVRPNAERRCSTISGSGSTSTTSLASTASVSAAAAAPAVSARWRADTATRTADDAHGDEEHDEHGHVLGLTDGPRVDGRREVPIDEQEAGHGRGQRREQPADGRDDDHPRAGRATRTVGRPNVVTQPREDDGEHGEDGDHGHPRRHTTAGRQDRQAAPADAGDPPHVPRSAAVSEMTWTSIGPDRRTTRLMIDPRVSSCPHTRLARRSRGRASGSRSP